MRQITGAIVLILLLVGSFAALLASLPKPITVNGGMNTGQFFAQMIR